MVQNVKAAEKPGQWLIPIKPIGQRCLCDYDDENDDENDDCVTCSA